MPRAAADADLMLRPAGELAGLVRRGELSARELVEASLRRIELLNPTYNAFIDVYPDDALAEADAIAPGDERPLAGVPIAIKNNRPVAGRRWTFGSSFFGDFAAPAEATLVTRLRRAGAIVVGSTNLPELGIVATTEPRRFGASRNPWDPQRTTGGSSGGSAAAVAAGMVPLAHANDGGGSIRIPAACCGLVGLKVQRGRITQGPFVGYSFLGVDGVLSRTTQDTALALDVLAGHQLGDVAWAAPPSAPFADQARTPPARLRIAMTSLPPVEGAQVHGPVLEALNGAASLLRELGHEVVEEDPPWAIPGLIEQFAVLWAPMISTQTAFGVQLTGRQPTDEDLEPLTMALWRMAKEIDAVTYLGVEMMLQAVARGMVDWTARFDAVLCPSLAELPVPLGTIDTCDEGQPMSAFDRSSLFTPFTPISNLTGSPAISVPLFHEELHGLPIGVQLIGQPEGEGALLALATQLEEARPWAERRAPVAVA